MTDTYVDDERPVGARPPVDPRVRERWIAARRAEGRRRFRILVTVLAVVTLGALAWGATVSPILDVNRVVVRGVQRLDRASVVDAAGVHPGDALVWFDASTAAARVEGLPWVRHARVERDFPGTVRIVVRERQPVAWVDATPVVLVDDEGRVLEATDAPPAGLPRLVGAESAPTGAHVRPRAAARVAAAFGTLRSGVTAVSVADGAAVARLASGVDVRFGHPTDLGQKIRAALAVVQALGTRSPGYVDVSVPATPVTG
jgi:cell division protein FtsQ